MASHKHQHNSHHNQKSTNKISRTVYLDDLGKLYGSLKNIKKIKEPLSETVIKMRDEERN